MRVLLGRRGAFHLDALPTVTDLQNRYVRDLANPGKAAGFLRELATKYDELTEMTGDADDGA